MSSGAADPGQVESRSSRSVTPAGASDVVGVPPRAFFRDVAHREAQLRRESVFVSIWLLVVAAVSPLLFDAAGWLSRLTSTPSADGPPPLSQLDLGLSSTASATAFTVLSAIVLTLQVAARAAPSPTLTEDGGGNRRGSETAPREARHRDAAGIARTRVLTQIALLAGGTSVFVGYFSALNAGLGLLTTRPAEVLVPIFLGLLLAAVSLDASGAIETRTQKSLQEDALRSRRSLALIGLVRVLGAPRRHAVLQTSPHSPWRPWVVALAPVVLAAGVGALAHPTVGTFLALFIFAAYATATTTALGYIVVRGAILHEYVFALSFAACGLVVLGITGLGSATLLLAGATTTTGAWAAMALATVIPGAGVVSAVILLGRRDNRTAGPVRLRLETGLRSTAERAGEDTTATRRRRGPKPSAVLFVGSGLVPGLGWIALRHVRLQPARSHLRRLVPAVVVLSSLTTLACVSALVLLVLE